MSRQMEECGLTTRKKKTIIERMMSINYKSQIERYSNINLEKSTMNNKWLPTRNGRVNNIVGIS